MREIRPAPARPIAALVRGRFPIGLAAAIAIGGAAAAATLVAQPPPIRSRLFDAPGLLRDLQVLSSDEMEGRLMGTPGNASARAYLIRRLEAAGLLPLDGSFEHPFTVPAMGPGRPARQGINIVGRIEGSRQPSRFVIVSAHYDHVGVRGGRVFNGADDNASGAAALVAVTEYFRAHPPLNSLLVVGFDGEESGLLGSRAFVRSPPVPRDSILIDVNADMLGRDPKDELFVVGVARQPFLRRHIERVAGSAPVRLLMGHEDPTGRTSDDWTDESDQYAFLEVGIPAIYVGVEDKPFHHQPTDDFDTIDHRFYVRAVETVIALAAEFDRNFGGAPR